MGYWTKGRRGKDGYLKDCRYCGERIYMHLCHDGWKPFESWVAGNAMEGEWVFHDCQRSPFRGQAA